MTQPEANKPEQQKCQDEADVRYQQTEKEYRQITPQGKIILIHPVGNIIRNIPKKKITQKQDDPSVFSECIIKLYHKYLILR